MAKSFPACHGAILLSFFVMFSPCLVMTRQLERCCLTVKLRGRIEAPAWSHGCTLSSRSRGDTTTLTDLFNDC